LRYRLPQVIRAYFSAGELRQAVRTCWRSTGLHSSDERILVRSLREREL